jgi:hypothetical protein
MDVFWSRRSRAVLFQAFFSVACGAGVRFVLRQIFLNLTTAKFRLGILLQENLYADTMDTPVHDREYCAQLAKHLMHMNSLPRGCLQYKDIANDLKRRDTDTTDPTSYLS